MLTPARMILCFLRAVGLIGALLACLIVKMGVILSLLVLYLASLVLLQRLKAAYLDDAWETLLCLVSSEARSRVLLARLKHLEDRVFRPYYHGRKPSYPVLFKGLSIVCDWWRTQQPTGLPPDVVVYLRLTCKTLHQLEQLAATHLTLKAPLYPSGVSGALNRPARWRRVQAVSYLHHKPEQLQALTLFAPAWPNLRQLRVTRPQYLHLNPQQWDGSKAGVETHSSNSNDGAFAVTVQSPFAGGSSIDGSISSSSSSHNLQQLPRSSDEAVLHLIAGLVSLAPHWPSLQCLSLSNLGLTPAAAQLLVQAAVQWPLLRCLDVTNNSLGTVGVQILLDAALQYWQQLEVIDVRGNLQLGSSSVKTSSSAGGSSSIAEAGEADSSGFSDALGLLTGDAKHLRHGGCRKVVLQSQLDLQPEGCDDTQPATGTAAGSWGSISHGSNQSSTLGLRIQSSSSHSLGWYQGISSSTTCRYIPTEGFVARHVHVVL